MAPSDLHACISAGRSTQQHLQRANDTSSTCPLTLCNTALRTIREIKKVGSANHGIYIYLFFASRPQFRCGMKKQLEVSWFQDSQMVYEPLIVVIAGYQISHPVPTYLELHSNPRKLARTNFQKICPFSFCYVHTPNYRKTGGSRFLKNVWNTVPFHLPPLHFQLALAP